MKSQIKKHFRRRALTLLCLMLLGISPNAWAAESYTFKKGTTIYIDFTNVDATDADIPKASEQGTEYKTGLGGTVYQVTFTNDVTWWTDQTFLKTSKDGWNTEMKFSKPGTNNCAKVAANGSSYNWTTYTPCEELTLRVYVASGTPKLHAWDGNVSTGSWPGTDFTSMGSGWWSYTFSQKPTGNFLVNTNKDDNKSANMNFSNYSLCKCWSYTKDKSLSEKDCPQSCTTPTISWSTAPADGMVGGSMMASVTKNQTSATVTWSSSKNSVATVTSAGVISYVGAGKATITAKYTGSGDYCAQEAKVEKEITVKQYTYFVNTDYWTTVKIHYWNEGETSWPGVAMTKDGTITINGETFDIYKYAIPSNAGFIFNNGESSSSNNKKQTADLSGHAGQYFVANDCFVAKATIKPDGTWYASKSAAESATVGCRYTDLDVAGIGTQTISANTVIQGQSVTVESTAAPAGYTFNKWTSDKGTFASASSTRTSFTPNANNAVATANYKANTNTPYVVKHYKQNVDGTSYPSDPTETENKTGTTDASVAPAVKSYTGFTAPTAQTVTIKGDGTLVVNYYYTRNKHKFAWNFDGGQTSSTTHTAADNAMPYGTAITYPADNTMSRSGYNFTGWSEVISTMPDNDVTITAQWAEDVKYAVTVKNKWGDTENTISTEQVKKGIETVINATVPFEGFVFKQWVATGGVAIKSSTSTTATIIATGIGTITAEYEQPTLSIGDAQTSYGYEDITFTPNVNSTFTGTAYVCYEAIESPQGANVDLATANTLKADKMGTYTIVATLHETSACSSTEFARCTTTVTFTERYQLTNIGDPVTFTYDKGATSVSIDKDLAYHTAYTAQLTDLKTNTVVATENFTSTIAGQYTFTINPAQQTPEIEVTMPESYTITVVKGANISAVTPTEVVYVAPNGSTAITATVPTGYTFAGWQVSGAGASVDGTSVEGNVQKATAHVASASATFTASATENTYTITLVGATATEVTAGVATHPTITANPAKFGQTFTGWSYDNTKVTLDNDKSKTATITNATAATTITATYARNTDEYYIEGRFRVRDSEGGNEITTYASNADWATESTNIKFDYDESNGRFYKQTFMTAKELSGSLKDHTPHLFVRQGTSSAAKGDIYYASSKFDLKTPGYANACTLQKSTGTTGDANLQFNSTDQSGNVTLYWDGTKIWYEVGTLKHVVTFAPVPATGAGSLGATVNSVAISSGDEVTQGSNVVFNALPTAGYAVQGWYSDPTCTQVIEAAGTNSSYTVENITAATNVYVKFTVAEVFFINTDKWTNVKIYDTGNSFGTWPGTPMTKDASTVIIQGRTFDVYKHNVTADHTIIFNNGEASGSDAKKQTADLIVTDNYGKYFMANKCYGASSSPTDEDKPNGTWYNSLAEAQEHGLDCTTDVLVVFDKANEFGTITATKQIGEAQPVAITSGALVDKGAKLVFKATPNSGYSVEGFYWNLECTDATRYTGAMGSTLTISNVENDTYVYSLFEQYFDVEIGVADGQSAMGTTQPVNTIRQVGAFSVRTAEAISSDPQRYSFDHWSLTINEVEKTDWDGTNYGVTLHDTCTIYYPLIRINATVADAKLTANFKARDVVTLYFVNSDNWENVRVHLWGGTATGTNWPGIEPELYDQKVNGHDVYYVTFDNGAYTKYIWSNNGATQINEQHVDKNYPVYNHADNTLYPSLDAVLPDAKPNPSWRVMFNTSSTGLNLLTYDESSYTYSIDLVKDKGSYWMKMQEDPTGQGDESKFNSNWRGLFKDAAATQGAGDTYTTLPATFYVKHNETGGGQPTLEFSEDQTAITLTFTQSKTGEIHKLVVDYTRPTALLTASANEWDVDSKEPLVLRGYAKNATAACTYQFAYSTDGGTNWTNIGTASTTNVMEVTKADLATVPDKLGTYQFKVVVTTTHKGETIQPEATKDVYLYKYYWLAVYDKNNWTKNIYVWNGGTYPTAYPGDVLTEHLTYETGSGNQEWYFYHFRYPTYTKFKWNDGQATGGHGTGDITFDPNTLCYTLHNYTNWDYKTDVCPNRLHVTFTAEQYYTSLEGAITLEPIVKYYGDGDLTYSWQITSGSNKAILSSDNADKISVYPKALGDVTVKLIVSGQNCQYEKTATIHIIDGITIRVYKRYSDWEPIIRTWGSGDQGTNYSMTNEGNGWYSHTTSLNPANFMIMKNASTGNNYDKTINVTNVTKSGCWIVSESKWSGGDDNDKHMIDKTEDCGLYFRVHETLADSKTTYHSNKVTKVGQDLSFYAANNGKLTLQHFDEAANKYVDIKTLTNPEESYVQVAKFAGNGISNMEKYTGDYWLRTNAFGDWNEYIKDAQKFTEFTRNSRFKNEEYNYYFVHHFAKGTLVTGQVANRINDNLATFIKEDAFTKSDGTLPAEGESNVRFGYCPETNYFKRAIINGSTSGDHFLEVYGDNSTYFNGGQNNSTLYRSTELTDANKIWRDETNNNSLIFTDMSDWVYQANVYATVDNLRNADTRAVIAAKYNGIWNYLLGYDDVKQRPTFAYDVLGSTSSKNITYAITLIYDFKTNRLMSAWTPTDMTVEESMEVDADVMFLRHENEDVAQIGIANETATVDNLNGVVFVLEVETDRDANTEKHYWVSTPFDVKVGDIFGLERFYDGVTGDAWGIQRYRGDLRAKTGWWAEGPDTWWEWMTKDDTMKAGEGYLISIDKSLFSWPSIEVDGKLKAIKRLYFPSVTSHLQMSRTKGESITQTYENQPCPFTRDRRDLKDGNWKIIGANSYNNAIATGGAAQGDYNPEAETPADGTKLPNFRYVHHDAPTVAGQSYTAEPGYGTDVVYRAFYSYPVQYAGTITWQPFTTDDQKTPELAPRRYTMENEVTNVILRLELQQNGKMMDQTFVQFNDAATTSYDLNLDLGKFGCGSKISEISTLDDNGVVYAGNSMPSGEYVIPVAVNIKVAGTYTFAMPAGTENMTVYLLDYETGDKIDLGLGNYTVTFSKKANLKDRFALQIDNRKLPTDTKVMDANGNELIKFIRNEQMYILRNGHLYNANGAELSK